MPQIAQDVRHALRGLRRHRGYAFATALTLALGVGVTTALFTVVHTVLLRPLPYRDPGRLVVVLHGQSVSGPVSPADYDDYRREARGFTGLAAAQAWAVNLTGDARPERVPAMQVSPHLFEVLGVGAAVGRTFTPDEATAGRGRVVVLGHGLWVRRFGGDRAVVGRTIRLDGDAYTVVGVMPPEFRFAPFWQTRAEIWAPLVLDDRRDDRGGRSLRVFGRLRDDVTLAQAREEVAAIASRLAAAHPDSNAGVTTGVAPLLDKAVGPVRPTLVLLFALAGVVLLIACGNAATLILTRALGRRREAALLAALGAGRARVIRLQLVEGLLLAAAGAGAGLLCADWATTALVRWLPPGTLPRQHEVGLDPVVFAFAAAVACAAGLLSAFAPAWQMSRADVTEALRDGGRSATEPAGSRRLRAGLVAAEVAMALVLLVSAGLLARTLWNLRAIDPGFDTDGVAALSVSLDGTPAGAREAGLADAFGAMAEGLGAMPGVTGAAAINHLPLAGDLWRFTYFRDDRPEPPPGGRTSAAFRVVSPGYFETMGLPLVSGRDFDARDREGAVPAIIVNRALAARQFGGRDPIGLRLRMPALGDAPLTIVGLAADARQEDWAGEPADEVYLPLAQQHGSLRGAAMTLVARTGGDAPALLPVMRQAAWAVEPEAAVYDANTLAAVVDEELWRERLAARLVGLFAALALVLAAIGIHGVVSYAVSRRTREFGLRLALGAEPRAVRRLALGEGLRPVAIGLAAGLVLTLVAARVMAGLLFGVEGWDPSTVLATLAILLAGAAVAAWRPAARAARLDPAAALREE